MQKKNIRVIASQDNKGNRVLMVVQGDLTNALVSNSGEVTDGKTLKRLKKIMNEYTFLDVRE